MPTLKDLVDQQAYLEGLAPSRRDPREHAAAPYNPWPDYGPKLADFALGLVPVIGSGRDAVNDFARGDYGWGAVNTGLAGLDAATLGGGTALKALLGKGVPALAGTFAGVGAKTANLDKLARAKQLEQEGRSGAEIAQETGWLKAPWDKQWRWEIDDSNSFYRGADAAGSSYMEDVFLHEPLYAAEPDLRNLRVTEGGAPNTGSYDAYLGKVQLGDGLRSSTALHELQHAIQHREGWDIGGSPRRMALDVIDAKYRTDELSTKLQKIEREAEAEADLWIAKYPEKVSEAIDYLKSKELYDEGDDLRQAVAYAIYNRDRVYSDITKEWRNAKTLSHSSPTALYQRLAGEAEARLTQARMNLTPEQRAAQYPYDPDYFRAATGVNLSDLITRYGDGDGISLKDLVK